MVIYLTVTVLGVVASVFVLRDYVIISGASLGALGLIGLSLFQALIFKLWSHDRENIGYEDTLNYSLHHELDHEAMNLSMKYHARMKMLIIPWLLVFVLYFGSVWKIVGAVGIYFLSFFPVRWLVKRNRGK